jgi:F0F1-type ATP synthase assembly protein I
MDIGAILTWVVIAIVALAVVALLVWFCIKFFKMTPADRKELIVQFLVGLVTLAENTIVGSGKGQEKLAWVEQQFNATAPWFLKIVLLLTKTANLQELIELALEKAKNIEWDKFKVLDGNSKE